MIIATSSSTTTRLLLLGSINLEIKLKHTYALNISIAHNYNNVRDLNRSAKT